MSNIRMLSRSYKDDHEAFVSNLKGTSAGDVFTCLAHIPLAIILLKLVQKSSLPLLLRDLVYLVLPVLLSLTILADYSYVTLLILLIGELVALQKILQTTIKLRQDRFHNNHNNINNAIVYPPSDESLLKRSTSFISLFKGGTVLATCISILAVDFRIFPRRFAKTETFGISLMDVGVAFFIISSALTSRYARGLTSSSSDSSSGSIKYINNNNHNNNNNGITSKIPGSSTSTSTTHIASSSSSSSKHSIVSSSFLLLSFLFQRIRSLLTHTKTIVSPSSSSSSSSFSFIHPSRNSFSYLLNRSIILCLGVGRLLLLKIFQYPEHVSEYGIHWNFFVTLFCVWCLADIIHFFFSRPYTPWVATMILIMYQLLLHENSMMSNLFSFELTNYIFSAPRDHHNFFNANREGICSLGGFLPLYLLAEHAAYQMFFKIKSSSSSNNINDNNGSNDDDEKYDNSNSGSNKNRSSNKSGVINDTTTNNNTNNSSATDEYQLQQPVAVVSLERSISSREKGCFIYSSLAAVTPTTADTVAESDAVTDAEDADSSTLEMNMSNNSNNSHHYHHQNFLFDDSNNTNYYNNDYDDDDDDDDDGISNDSQQQQLLSKSNDKVIDNNNNNNNMDYLDLAVSNNSNNSSSSTIDVTRSSSSSSSSRRGSSINNNNNITNSDTTNINKSNSPNNNTNINQSSSSSSSKLKSRNSHNNSNNNNSNNNNNMIHLYGIIPWRILVPPIYRSIIRQLSVLAFSLWSLWVLSSILIQPTSRRLTNIPFVLFSFALAMTCLLLTLLADIITGCSHTVKVVTLEVLNRFQLPVFLFANILTGLVNLFLPTMYISPVLAFFILVVYTSVVVSFAWFLGSRKIFHRK